MDHKGGYYETADQGCVWLLAACLGPQLWAQSTAYRLYVRSVYESSILRDDFMTIRHTNSLSICNL